ncbi:unnamed protein product, partial [Symbiodinium microadriaticum]
SGGAHVDEVPEKLKPKQRQVLAKKKQKHATPRTQDRKDERLLDEAVKVGDRFQWGRATKSFRRLDDIKFCSKAGLHVLATATGPSVNSPVRSRSPRIHDCNVPCGDPPCPSVSLPTSVLGLLEALQYEVRDNPVTSHCWWHASSCHTGLPADVAMLQALKYCSAYENSAQACLKLIRPATSVSEIGLAVSGLCRFYSHGLLVLHAPASCAYLFRPQRSPCCIDLPSAYQVLSHRPRVHVMLFTQDHGAAVGHYAACLKRTHEPSATAVLPQRVAPSSHASTPAMFGGMLSAKSASRSRSPPEHRFWSPTSICSTDACAAARPVAPDISTPQVYLSDPSVQPWAMSRSPYSPRDSPHPSPPSLPLAQTLPSPPPCSAETLATVLDSPSSGLATDTPPTQHVQRTQRSEISRPAASPNLLSTSFLADALPNSFEEARRGSTQHVQRTQRSESSRPAASPNLLSTSFLADALPNSFEEAHRAWHLQPDWSCLEDHTAAGGDADLPLVTTQDLVDWTCHPPQISAAAGASRSESPGQQPPTGQAGDRPAIPWQGSCALRARAEHSFRLLSCATRGTSDAGPVAAEPPTNPALFATRIYQIQALSPVPVTFRVAKAAARQCIHSLPSALQLAANLQLQEFSVAGAECTLPPPMEGGMHTPAAADSDLAATLRTLGIPTSVAAEAARLHPLDINAALDWACGSGRRHRAHRSCMPAVVNLCSSPSSAESASQEPVLPPQIPSPVPSVPLSWRAPDVQQVSRCAQWESPPPTVLPSTTASWWVLPLLLAAADLLSPASQSAWAQHPAAHTWWSNWRERLASRRVTLEGLQVACSTLFAASAEQARAALLLLQTSSLSEPFSLAEMYPHLCNETGYIPAGCQELLLQTFCAEAELQSLLHHAHSMREMLRTSSPSTTSTHALETPRCLQMTRSNTPPSSSPLPAAQPDPPLDSEPTAPVAPLSRPCFRADAAAEVEHYFRLLANSNCAVLRDEAFWAQMPMYSQYIREHSVAEIVADSLLHIDRLRQLDLSIEDAARLPTCLGTTTTLPVAVMCEYLHRGCGLPSLYVFDLFQACLASCQHKSLAVALYHDRSTTFTCKARWWAAPVGDPNAGKSPAFGVIADAFEKLVQAHRHLFYPIDHFIGVGNNGKIQERLRKNEGVLLLWGPEAKPILDPLYPGRETVDVAKYLDFGRWLEAANGGKFEWGTGAEEKSLKRPDARRRAEEETIVPLSFNPTNVNLCLFQQYRLFRKWWVTVEQNHSCGFSARILMNATARAIVDKDTGLLDSSPITKALQSIWLRTAAAWGPRASQPNQFLRPSTEAQKCIRRFYYTLHEQEERGGWGSATKASLGKMEYHVPTAACLTALVQFSAMQEEPTYVLSDNAVKCGIRHFDMRVVHSCAVVDSEISAKMLQAPASSRRPGSPPTQRAERTLPQRLLAACTKNPITMTEVGVHISSLKGAAKYDARLQLFQELQGLGLGEIKSTRRRPNSEDGGRGVEFHRFALSPAIEQTLAQMRIPLCLWPLPAMNGAGKRAKAKARAKAAAAPKGRAKAEAVKTRGRPPADRDDIYPVKTPAFPVETPFTTKEAFLDHEKSWASRLVENRVLKIRHQWYAEPTGFKVLLWCNSCTCCKDKNGWRGYSTYSAEDSSISRAYTPCSQHGDFAAIKRWTPLTSTSEHALLDFVKTTTRFTTQDLVKIVEKHQDIRPTDAWLTTWSKNHRVNKGTKSDPISQYKWVEADWRRLERELGSTDGLQDVPDALKVAGLQVQPNATVVVFCNPRLVKETLQRLVNKEYVKLCGDGTFRLVKEDEWVLLTVGALSKHYAPASAVFAFRSTFNPLAFAVANKENEHTYKFFF